VNVLNHAMKAKDLIVADAVLRLDALARAMGTENGEQVREVAADLADIVLPVSDSARTPQATQPST